MRNKVVCNITEVVLDPESRREHIKNNLKADGLTEETIRKCITKYKILLSQKEQSPSKDHEKTTHFLDDILANLEKTGFVESPNACYSGLALTGVPPEQRESLLKDHMRIKRAVKKAGLKNYDPAEAPFNPQHKLVGLPTEVSDVDVLMVVSSQYFTFTNLTASSGGGMELRTANIYNKIPIVIMKKGVYVSRLTTGARRALLFEYKDLKQQERELADYIGFTRQYQPGIGTCTKHENTLLGFKNGSTYCLPGMMEQKFPSVKFDFSQYQK